MFQPISAQSAGPAALPPAADAMGRRAAAPSCGRARLGRPGRKRQVAVAKSVQRSEHMSTDPIHDGVPPGADTVTVTVSEVAVPMRDGAVLRADVYQPGTQEVPRPVVLLRTAYDRTTPRVGQMVNVGAAIERGFVVVIQDVRGRYASDGVFSPFRAEVEDGFDTVEWLAAQEYCDGSVTIVGASYSGCAAWLAAASGAPHLRAIAVTLCPVDPRDGWVAQGGAFLLAFNLFWAAMTIGPEDQRRRENGSWDVAVPFVDASQPWNFKATVGDRMAAVLPLCEVSLPEVLEQMYVPEFYPHWLDAYVRSDAYWSSISALDRAADIRCPVLAIGGWYQSFLAGSYRGFSAVRWCSASEASRERSRLVIGPWENSMPAPGNTTAGEIDFGPAAGFDLDRATFDFFDDVLAGGSANPVEERVHYFEMGSNEWKATDAWPPRQSRGLRLHLHEDGSLDSAPPRSDEGPRHLLIEPDQPLPTVGGNTIPGLAQGPRDHASQDNRSDVLVYRSQPLDEPLILAGPVSTVLHVSGGEAPSDWTACLSYTTGNGRVINICDGIRRVTDPTVCARVSIDMLATAIHLPKGTSLHLRVGHSNFPRFDLASRSAHPASREVHHDTATGSHLHLTVMPGSSPSESLTIREIHAGVET
jgi:putative CocE/NonD family hydrolase